MKFATILYVSLFVVSSALAPFSYAEKRTAPLSQIRDDIRKEIAKKNLRTLPTISSQVAPLKKLKKSDTTPPALSNIGLAPIKDLFWRSIDGLNVVDAINQQNFGAPYCGEFFVGAQNGESGGLGACFLAESVGYSYKTVLDGSRSLCYMQTFPVKTVQKAGGINITKGKLPPGGLEALFSTPTGKTARRTKVTFLNVSNQTATLHTSAAVTDLYFEVQPERVNKSRKNIYQASLWLCDGTSSNGIGYDLLTLSNSLRLSINHGGRYYLNGDTPLLAQELSSVSGLLTTSGKRVIWDASKERTSNTIHYDSDGGGYKSNISIGKDGVINLMHVDSFTGRQGRGAVATKYSGDTAESLRFLNGAYNEIQDNLPIRSGTRYNGIFYEVNTSEPLASEVNAEDLNAGFYTSGLQITVDMTPFRCDVASDVELTVDLANQAVQAAIAPCLDTVQKLSHVRFCDDDVEVAQARGLAESRCGS